MDPRFVLTAVFAATIFNVPLNTSAQDWSQRQIEVYGTATTEVAPDTMVWRIGVRTSGKVVDEVAVQHDKNVSSVLEFLGHEEVRKEKIQTSQLQLAEDFEYRGGTRTKKGYFAASSISFESGTMDAYRSLWIGLSKLEAVSINGVSFDTSKRIQVQDQTRDRALAAAKTKAERMAAVLNSRAGKPLSIQEEAAAVDNRQTLFTNNRMARVASENSPSGPSLSVGTIPIQVRVKVVFELIN